VEDLIKWKEYGIAPPSSTTSYDDAAEATDARRRRGLTAAQESAAVGPADAGIMGEGYVKLGSEKVMKGFEYGLYGLGLLGGSVCEHSICIDARGCTFPSNTPSLSSSFFLVLPRSSPQGFAGHHLS
jgi:hypothetical protein